MLLIGGLGSYLGVVVGAVVMETLLEGTRTIGFSLSDTQLASLRFMIVGALLILIVVVRPQGLFGKRSEMLIRR
jgi:ABC-type branched-subunit amino acid transport system permease subunit